jgi:hypothetical protein
MSRIMCTASPKVKPTRKSRRPATRFGAGILRYVASDGRQPFTQSDLDWLAQNSMADENRRLDQMAGEALAISRHEMGLRF